MSERPKDGNAEEVVKTVSFAHRESQSFRVIHVDGAFGGLTPNGKLYAAMYSQIPPNPFDGPARSI